MTFIKNKYSIGLFILSIFIFIGCQDDSLSPTESETPNENEITSEKGENPQPEVAFPDIKGEAVEISREEGNITLIKKDGRHVLDGDILLTEEQVIAIQGKKKTGQDPEVKSTFRTQVSSQWANGTVYYTIDGNLGNQARVQDAIAHWEANTSLQFVQRSDQSNYVEFVQGNGCSSYIGMIGGRQPINLAPGCSTGNTIHEIGHAVGLFHEQSRADRDEYITIIYNNIESGRENNFNTYIQQGIPGDETGTLDFNSIMMYPPYAFSNGNGPTIVKKDGSTYITQREALSQGDLVGINTIY